MALIHRYSTASADNFRLMKSKPIVVLATGNYGLFLIPPKAFILDFKLEVVTAFNGSAPQSLTIGWLDNSLDDPDGFMDAAATAIDVAGMKPSAVDSQPYSDGKYCIKGGSIYAAITAGDGTAGEAYAYVMYSVIH